MPIVDDIIITVLESQKLYKVNIKNEYGMKIPNVPPYIEGELMWSYIARLAYANGFQDVKWFLNTALDGFDKRRFARFREWNYDLDRPQIDALLSIDDIDWILGGTLYRAMLPFSSVFCSAKRIYNHSRLVGTDSGFLFRPESDIRDIRVCPECRNEDLKSGVFHLRTIHQMPGISLCPYHNAPLLRYVGEKGFELDTDSYEPMELSVQAEEVSHFLCDLWRLNPEFQLVDVLNVIKSKVLGASGKKNVDSVTIRKVMRNDQRVGALCESIPGLDSILCAKGWYRNRISPMALVPLLIVLFGSAQALCNAIEFPAWDEKAFRANIAADDRFDIVGTCQRSLVRLRCNVCGSSFISTPSAIIMGFGCPTCDEKMPEEDIIRRMVAISSCGTWEYRGGYSGAKDKIAVVEISTGRLETVKPREFIALGDVKQSKYKDGNIEYYKTIMKKYPDYELLSVEGSDSNKRKLRLLHKACGNEFTVLKRDFFTRPFCRACEAPFIHDYEREILEISNGEFRYSGIDGSGFMVATDGETTVRARRFYELKDRVNRSARNGGEKRDFAPVRQRIEWFMNNRQGEIVFLDDMCGFGERDVIRACCTRLVNEGRLKRLADGTYCNIGEEHSLAELLFSKFCIRHEHRIGVPVCDTLLENAGIIISNPKSVFGVHVADGIARNLRTCELNGKVVAKIASSPVPIPQKGWEALALVMTLEHSSLLSVWNQSVKAALAMWLTSRGVGEDDLRALSPHFSVHIIAMAVKLLLKEAS